MDENHRRKAGAARIAAAIVGLFALGLVVGLVVDGDDAEDGSDGARATSVAAVAAEPAAFLDDDVLVSAQVAEVLGPRTFVVGGGRFVEGGRRLLVVAERPIAIPSGPRAGRPLLEGDLVQVVGRVMTFDTTGFEEEIGAELERDFSFFDGRPAVLAESVTVTPQLRPVAGEASVESLLGEPERFYGEVVTVRAPVKRVLRRDAFVVGEGDRNLLVLTTWGEPVPEVGERVEIAGAIRRFDPDQRLPGGALADDELFGDYADQPALIAERIAGAGPD